MEVMRESPRKRIAAPQRAASKRVILRNGAHQDERNIHMKKPIETTAPPSVLTTQVVTIALGDIKPNPFRDPARYLMSETAISALMASIAEAGLWQNTLLGRRVNGEIELVFGHKRVEAGKRKLGADQPINLHLAKIDDAGMVRNLVLENMREWNSDARHWIEDLRTVVLGFAEDKIALAKASRKAGDLRVAPGFLKAKPDADTPHVYSVATLHAFNSAWNIDDVRDGLDILEHLELGTLQIDMLDQLSPAQAKDVLKEVLTAQTLVQREVKVHRKAAEAAQRQGLEAVEQAEQAPSPEARKEAAKTAARAAKVVEKETAAASEAEQSMTKIMAEVGVGTAEGLRSGKPVADVKVVVRKVQREAAQTIAPTTAAPPDHGSAMKAETGHLYRSFRRRRNALEANLRHAAEFDAASRENVLSMWRELKDFAITVEAVLTATAPRAPGEAATHVRSSARRQRKAQQQEALK
jgi:hypothetical protein